MPDTPRSRCPRSFPRPPIACNRLSLFEPSLASFPLSHRLNLNPYLIDRPGLLAVLPLDPLITVVDPDDRGDCVTNSLEAAGAVVIVKDGRRDPGQRHNSGQFHLDLADQPEPFDPDL